MTSPPPPLASVPDSSSSASGSGNAPSLETNLGFLLAALDRNGSDDWRDKPPQERFRVYTPLTTTATVQKPSGAEVTTRESADGPTLATHGEAGVEAVDGSSPVTQSHPCSSSGAAGDEARASLDALMAEYVTALRGLRAVDHVPTASTLDEAGADTQNTNSDSDRCAHPQQVKESEDTASPRTALDFADVQSLLNAVDQLPPLTKK